MTYLCEEEETSTIKGPRSVNPSRIVTVAYCSFFVLLALAAIGLMMVDPSVSY